MEPDHLKAAEYLFAYFAFAWVLVVIVGGMLWLQKNKPTAQGFKTFAVHVGCAAIPWVIVAVVKAV